MLLSPLSIDEIVALPSTKVGLGVLGRPIAHSISPILHHAALAKLSSNEPNFSNWKYERIDVDPGELSHALIELQRSGYIGLNLTIPHKVEILRILETVDDEAKMMGAVNTLHYEQGKWVGYNTDGYGLSRGISNDLSFDVNESNVLILGAGGAARAAAVQCLLDGCKRLFVVNRSLERLKNLVTPLIQKFGSHRVTGSDLKNLTLNEFEHKKWLVVNATSVGLKEDDPSALPFNCSLLGEGSAVYDMIYNPLKTTLLKDADHAGLLSANGLSMLAFQAAKALEVWTQKKVSAEIMMMAAKDYFLRSNE